MALIDTLKQQITEALKAHDEVRLGTLRFIVSQISYKQIDKGGEITDADVVACIRKQIKELEEAKVQFLAGGRADLAAENDVQIKILQEFLPAEVSDEELTKLITDFVTANQAAHDANPKAFTGKVVAALKDKADPSRISKIYQSGTY